MRKTKAEASGNGSEAGLRFHRKAFKGVGLQARRNPGEIPSSL